LENKGNAIGSYGKCDEAIKAFDKAIAKKPQYADAWNNKGSAFKLLGCTEEAKAAFSKAKELGHKAWDIRP
jgi:Flp pilus assembly protein TadD